MVKMLIFLFVLPVCLGQQIPDYMTGNFKLETSKGFSDFMYEVGVGWFTRSIACTLYPLQKIRQDDKGVISIDTITTFRSTSSKFKIEDPWKETTADGRVLTTTARVEGNKLIKEQVAAPGSGYLTSTETREYTDGGNTMNHILTIEGNDDIRSFRVYKRQPLQ